MEVAGSEDLCGVEDRALDEASGSLPFPSALVPLPATKPVGGPFTNPGGLILPRYKRVVFQVCFLEHQEPGKQHEQHTWEACRGRGSEF